LKLAPKFALLAADAVHDAADVSEVVAKFDFKLRGLKSKLIR
jgi:hypothetical protein